MNISVCLRFKGIQNEYGILSAQSASPFCFQFNCAAISLFGELHPLASRQKDNVMKMDI